MINLTGPLHTRTHSHIRRRYRSFTASAEALTRFHPRFVFPSRKPNSGGFLRTLAGQVRAGPAVFANVSGEPGCCWCWRWRCRLRRRLPCQHDNGRAFHGRGRHHGRRSRSSSTALALRAASRQVSVGATLLANVSDKGRCGGTHRRRCRCDWGLLPCRRKRG